MILREREEKKTILLPVVGLNEAVLSRVFADSNHRMIDANTVIKHEAT